MHTPHQRTPSAFSAALAGPKAVLNIRLCQALSDDMHAAMFLTHLIFFQEFSEWPPEFVDVDRSGVNRKMFCRTWSDIYNYTCISQDKQVYVKKFLKEIGLIDSVVMGIPAKTYYWVDIKAVEALMSSFLEDGTTAKRSSKLPSKKIEKDEVEASETDENGKNNDLQMQKQEFADANTGICNGKFYYIESTLREHNKNKNNPARENENSEAKKYTNEDARNWKWENPQLESEKCLNYENCESNQDFEFLKNAQTDDFGFFDFSTENENPKIETSTVEVKNTETIQNCAVPEFFDTAPTQVHEAINGLLNTKFTTERFAHHYEIHGGIKFLEAVERFFTEGGTKEAIRLLRASGVETMEDVWPLLAAYIDQVVVDRQGYDRFGGVSNHIRNFFTKHAWKLAEIKAARSLAAAKQETADQIARRNKEFSVKVNQDKIKSSQPQPQKRNQNVRGLNFLNANGTK